MILMVVELKNMFRNWFIVENIVWVLLVICIEGFVYFNIVLKEYVRYMYIKGVIVLIKVYSLKFIVC